MEKRTLTLFSAVFLILTLVACSTPLTTREKAAGIGVLGGAAAGGIIGSAVGRPAAGALIGGGLGLAAGALIGDQLQGRENEQKSLEHRIEIQQKELERLYRCLKAMQSDVRPLPPGC